jgi:PadR family transcriptional regulator PadR
MGNSQHLGEFEELVLLAVERLGKTAYGVSIRQTLEEHANRSASIGAIYVTLQRLEEKGLVRSRRGEATAERGGRAKRYYEVEAAGEKALAEVELARGRLRVGRQIQLEGS